MPRTANITRNCEMKQPGAIAIWSFLLLTSSVFAAGDKVSYTALSDAARERGSLDHYSTVPTVKRELTLDGHRLEFEIPRNARAYDVIPINYTFQQDQGSCDLAMEATAFEDSARAKARALYDLAIPGNMKVEIEYLGSISADFLEDEYIPLTADPKTPISPFPPFKRDGFVRSSTIRASNLVWFKFKVTNVGDTILDPEGFAGCFAEPFIYKLDDDGTQLWQGTPVNLFTRHLEYVYPGESYEQWVNFHCPPLGENRLGLTEGKYQIAYRMVCRFHDEYDWGTNIWRGTEFARLEVPISVTHAPAPITPVEAKSTMQDTTPRMPGYLSSFEEFMTSFEIYPACQQTISKEGTLYLQVAPWTENVVVKLITREPKKIAAAKIPIEISHDTLEITHNPRNTMVIEHDGEEEPVFLAQIMPAMRLSMLTPFPEADLFEIAKEARDLGVNVVVNTSAGWWASELTGRKGVEMHSACYKYFYDVVVRKLDMKVMGWSVYPPCGSGWFTCAEPLLKKTITFATTDSTGTLVDVSDPVVPEVIAAWTRYQYERWGDTWFKTRDGRVPIDIEDSWGWMRDDINIRHNLGKLGLQRFGHWLQSKYKTIDTLNSAWGTDYTDFSEIQPEKDQGREVIPGGHSHPYPCYNKPDHVFHDWNGAVEDWDTFRTVLRLDIIEKTNEMIRATIPGAELALRTEGANLPIRGDGKSDKMHWRHVYYSQRRNAFVHDVVKARDVVHFYSDYTTLPYTPEEWRQAMKEMVADGIVPMFLPQFDHMRDILLNPSYGLEYQTHYNLEEPSKGVMIHCLMAAYPWWKATYEEGGAPGILWSDYLCDGFATETQKRELKLLRQAFGRMKPR